MSIQNTHFTKILILDSQPDKAVANRFWFNTTDNYLYRYNENSQTWDKLHVNINNVDVSVSEYGFISLSEYLNSQFDIVGDGLDSLETNKQDKTDNSLTTTSKEIVAAINEINTIAQSVESEKQDKNISLSGISATTVEDALVEINNKLDPVNNLDALTITPTTTTDGVSITSTSSISGQSKPGNVIITPSINNVGAIYVGTSASSKPTSLPIYPDTVVQYSDSNLDNLFIFVDSVGDSCGVQISYND